jgi:hypothetical protein
MSVEKDDPDASAHRALHDRRVTVDELVAKSHSVIDRVRPIVQRAVANVRARLGRAREEK